MWQRSINQATHPLEGLLAKFSSSTSMSPLSDPNSLEAGDRIELPDGQRLEVPAWVKGNQPQRISPVTLESLVDYSLPLTTNVFYKNFEQSIRNTGMGIALESVDESNILLPGSSGCGKTFACFSLAAKRFVIFLECPASGYHQRARSCRGYRMDKTLWCSKCLLQTEEDVEQLFCCELAARLLVLVSLLRRHGAAITPLKWLCFVQSAAGASCIGDVFDYLSDSVGADMFDLVDHLLMEVQRLQGSNGPEPVLVVDEVQQFSTSRTVVDHMNNSLTVLKAVIRAAGMFSCGAVWSGTQIDVSTAVSSEPLGIAKQVRGHRKLRVVGDFKYLTPEDVARYLDSVLHLDVSDSMHSQLCHLLQGRACMVTGFIELLLTPIPEGGGSVRVTMRGAGLARLNDEVLRDALEEFMETLVVRRYLVKITRMLQPSRTLALGPDDLCHLWCLTALMTYTSPAVAHCDAVRRFDSLAFTSGLHEVHDPAASTAEVNYRYDYVFGEPGLVEALRRIVVRERALADFAIMSILDGALATSAIGGRLDLAVALALVSRQNTVLGDICGDNRFFQCYKAHELVITRVVATRSAEEQLEWFEKLVNDPDDDTFSLMPGVPVRFIAILPCNEPGADVIAVAVTPVSGIAPPSPLQYLRSKKRQCDQTSQPQPQDRLVLVQFSCAGHAEGVAGAKEQCTSAEPSAAGKRYKELAEEPFLFWSRFLRRPLRSPLASTCSSRRETRRHS